MRFAAADHRPGQRDSGGIAVFRGALHRGTAGKAEAEDLGGLVEGFAQRIVDRGRQPAILPHAVDAQDLAMPARHQQQCIGKGDARVCEAGAQCMAFEMVDRDQRRVARHCQRLGTDQADHHPADQPGAGSRGDRVALVQADARILQHALDHRGEPFGMRARCNLGHHAAEGGVLGILRGDPLRHDPAIAVDQRDRGFVAGAFYAENQCHPAFP